jgi:AraC family transcriptional regulator
MEGLTLTNTVYTHSFVDWHYHENAYFTFILQGGVIEGNRKEVYECMPGSLLYHNWQDPHYNQKPDIFTRGMQIELDQRWIDGMIDGLGQIRRTRNAANGAAAGLPAGSLRLQHPAMKLLFYRIFRESQYAKTDVLKNGAEDMSDPVLPVNHDSLVAVAIQQLLLEAFSLMSGDSGRAAGTPSWVGRLREMLHAEYIQPRSLKELAAILDLHPVHLSRDFRKYFRCTLGEYIRSLRVERSLALLAELDLSLTEIAYSCGFADQSHFIRCFRISQGCSPAAYRKRLH